MLGILLQRERVLVTAGLALVTALAWAYTVLGVGMPMSAWTMTQMDRAMTMPTQPWTPVYGVLVFLMWWIMMIAMMLPSAAPVILLHAAIVRCAGSGAGFQTAFFVTGYVVMWGAFSIAATALHYGLDRTGLLNPMMALGGGTSVGLVLLLAGVHQLTPLKRSCLDRCRSPVGFLTRYWQRGAWGAFRMGLRHGVFCLGCCAFLMVLLIAGGIMNLYAIVGLALYVAIEKFWLHEVWSVRIGGLALIGAGVYFLVAA
jgi:predicted metal-binding membrane protein